MMNGWGGCLAILPLISTSDHNITAPLFIIALKMIYGKNTGGRDWFNSFKSIIHSLLSVEGTLQKRGIALLSICIQRVNYLVTPCLSKPFLATRLISLIQTGYFWKGKAKWETKKKKNTLSVH